ncbi:unnamed protein product, partial [Adineta ricciae]
MNQNELISVNNSSNCEQTQIESESNVEFNDNYNTKNENDSFQNLSFDLQFLGLKISIQLIIRILICLSLMILMTIGIIIVCFTTPKSKMKYCELNFVQRYPNLIEYNYDPRSVAIGDFNHDSWMDMVIVNSIVNQIDIYLGLDDQSFSKQFYYSTGINSKPTMVAVNHLNDDFYLDIVVSNYGKHSIGIFYGLGNGSFRNQKEISTGISRPISVHLVDINNDSFCDIIVINYGTNSFTIFYRNQYDFYGKSQTYSTGYDSHPYFLTTGDLNNDQRLDIIIANHGTNNIGVFFANENNSFEDQLMISMGRNSRPVSVAITDLNSDHQLDIVVTNFGTNMVCVMLNDQNGTFSKQTFYTTGSVSPYSIGIGDFNGDDHLDLFITNIGINNIGLFLGYGNGSFRSGLMNSTGSSSSISLALFDLNKDERLDAIIVNNDTENINVLHGYFQGFPLPTKFDISSPSTFII